MKITYTFLSVLLLCLLSLSAQSMKEEDREINGLKFILLENNHEKRISVIENVFFIKAAQKQAEQFCVPSAQAIQEQIDENPPVSISEKLGRLKKHAEQSKKPNLDSSVYEMCDEEETIGYVVIGQDDDKVKLGQTIGIVLSIDWKTIIVEEFISDVINFLCNTMKTHELKDVVFYIKYNKNLLRHDLTFNDDKNDFQAQMGLQPKSNKKKEITKSNKKKKINSCFEKFQSFDKINNIIFTDITLPSSYRITKNKFSFSAYRWSLETHKYFPDNFKQGVQTFLLALNRLKKTSISHQLPKPLFKMIILFSLFSMKNN